MLVTLQRSIDVRSHQIPIAKLKTMEIIQSSFDTAFAAPVPPLGVFLSRDTTVTGRGTG
jgi:hypothetical protein